MSLISCEGVTLGYGANTVLRGLDFSVEEGDFLCVVGPNGSGKSTLVKALLGLLAPFEGRVSYGGGLSQRSTGYLPQHKAADPAFPAGAFEVVLSGCLGRKGVVPFYTKSDRELAMKHMERLGISALRDRRFGELSGGQRQRTLLARALCSAGKLIILDEPTTGLDPAATADFYDALSDVREENMAVVMVSHDVGRAMAEATRVLHLDGRQRFFGPKREYEESELGRRFTRACA